MAEMIARRRCDHRRDRRSFASSTRSPPRYTPPMPPPGRPAPALARAAALVAVAFLVLPLVGLAARAPWGRAGDVLRAPATLDAFRLSLVVSTTATAFSFVFGFPLGWWLARGGGRAMAVVRPVVLLPLVLPPVVGGVGLLAALGRRGIVGAWLARLGIHLPFTTTGAILAATFVSLPLVALAVEGGFRALDPRFEDAAAAMGASRGYTLRRVTLPLLGAQVAAGLALGWARALGEFGATITFAGNLQGRTQTLPLAVYELLQTDPDAAIVVSLILVVVAAAVLIILHRRLFGAA